MIYNTRYGMRWREFQNCIFFTKLSIDKENERTFLKKFELEGWINSHKNSNETIALYLGAIEEVDKLYMEIRTYACMHCGIKKEYKYSFPTET